MRIAALLAAGVGIAVPAWTAQAQHRELGPHQHGHGTLNIAIEGGRVSMELDVPGAEELEVNLVTTKGQTKFEVKRGKPRIDLTGAM